MKRALYIFLLFFVAGCATTQQTAIDFNQRYAGKKVDEFFAKYGPPISKRKVSGDEVIYLWRSGAKMSVGEGANTRVVKTYEMRSIFDLSCEINFVTDAGGIIKKVDVNDSVGKGSLSYCNELFSAEPPPNR